ncbi:hypothetical protein Efla_000002 [Eimeria flavescens]
MCEPGIVFGIHGKMLALHSPGTVIVVVCRLFELHNESMIFEMLGAHQCAERIGLCLRPRKSTAQTVGSSVHNPSSGEKGSSLLSAQQQQPAASLFDRARWLRQNQRRLEVLRLSPQNMETEAAAAKTAAAAAIGAAALGAAALGAAFAAAAVVEAMPSSSQSRSTSSAWTACRRASLLALKKVLLSCTVRLKAVTVGRARLAVCKQKNIVNLHSQTLALPPPLVLVRLPYLLIAQLVGGSRR